MANVLSREKREQVKALGRLGWSLRRIEDATGVRRETASQYLKAAGIAVRAPRTRRAPEPNPASQVSTESASVEEPVRPGRSPTASACEPHREFIEASRRKGRNAMAIWEDLVDDHGFTSRYSSVKRFVNKLAGEPGHEACCVISTPPGQEAQVDYGTGPMVRHPETGKYRRTRLFVLTLGYSRKAVRLLTFKSSSRIWAELHEEAFRRLGGATEIVVLDNLREGVIKPDIYDPTINPLYRDVLAHYNVTALPCRVRDPDRKGKVERGVGHAKGTPLKGLRFECLEDAQAYLDRWEERWADTRIHGTTKRQVQTMFAEEKPALAVLPVEPFRYYEYGSRTVHLDGCVEVAGAYYGTEPGWLCQEVPVQWDELHVRIMYPGTNELMREHLRQKRGYHRVEPQDLPRKTPQSTEKLLRRAQGAGASIGTLCGDVHRRSGELGVRRILGVLSLVKKHGAAVVDNACAVAIDVGAADYRFVRRYLDKNPAAPLTLRQIDPLIRELTHYRDVIDRIADGENV